MYFSNFDLFDKSLYLNAFYIISFYNFYLINKLVSTYPIKSNQITVAFKDEILSVLGLGM